MGGSVIVEVMTSSEGQVPDEVLELLRKIKQLVDETVLDVERRASGQGSAIERTLTDDVGATDSVTGTIVSLLPAFEMNAAGTITAVEIESARSWVEAARNGGVVAMDVLDRMDVLFSWGERLAQVLGWF